MAQLPDTSHPLRLFSRHNALWSLSKRNMPLSTSPHKLCLFYLFFYVLFHLTGLFQSCIIFHFHKPGQALLSPALAEGSGSEEQVVRLYPLHSKDKMEICGFTENLSQSFFYERWFFNSNNDYSVFQPGHPFCAKRKEIYIIFSKSHQEHEGEAVLYSLLQ